jgi:hypothetical protein
MTLDSAKKSRNRNVTYHVSLQIQVVTYHVSLQIQVVTVQERCRSCSVSYLILVVLLVILKRRLVKQCKFDT